MDYGNAPPEEDTIPGAGLMPLYGCVQLSSHNSWSVTFSDMVVCKVISLGEACTQRRKKTQAGVQPLTAETENSGTGETGNLGWQTPEQETWKQAEQQIRNR